MGFIQNYLSFDVVETHNCNTLAILDTSAYADEDLIEGKVLQVKVPGYDDFVELNYYESAITILNSNSLKLTNVSDPIFYTTLPDGLWAAKISICPFEDNWFEKSWYRTCQLECKYYQAFLKLQLDQCTNCYNKQTADKLTTIWMYMQGIHANVSATNFKKATQLYTVANKMLDNILDCDDCK